MPKFNKSEATYIVAFLFLITMLLLIYFKDNKQENYSENYWKNELKDIRLKYDNLQLKYDSLKDINHNRLLKIDTVEKIKTQIEYVYLDKDNQIDTFGISSIINSFQRILAKSNRK